MPVGVPPQQERYKQTTWEEGGWQQEKETRALSLPVGVAHAGVGARLVSQFAQAKCGGVVLHRAVEIPRPVLRGRSGHDFIRVRCRVGRSIPHSTLVVRIGVLCELA